VKPDARSRSARKYVRGEGRFAKLLKFTKLDTKLLEHNFFILPKINGYQVDLANSQRHSKPAKLNLSRNGGRAMSCPTRLPARSPNELLRLHVVHLDLVDISMSEAVKLLPLTSRTDEMPHQRPGVN
jgi:hypothetical protein